MSKILMPENFDSQKFSEKYGLSYFDYRAEGDYLICPMLDITSDDLVDCVKTLSERDVHLSSSKPIILADGEDIAVLTFRGEPNVTIDYTVNGQAQSLTLDDSGTDVLELTCDTPNTTLLVQAGTARAVIYAVEVPA